MTLVTSLIQKTHGVCGGNACVRDTRIPVWTLHRLKELGRDDEQLLTDFPSLLATDLPAAWEYVRLNREEIEQAIAREGRTR